MQAVNVDTYVSWLILMCLLEKIIELLGVVAVHQGTKSGVIWLGEITQVCVVGQVN